MQDPVLECQLCPVATGHAVAAEQEVGEEPSPEAGLALILQAGAPSSSRSVPSGAVKENNP